MNTFRKFLLFRTCGDKRIRTFLWVACRRGFENVGVVCEVWGYHGGNGEDSSPLYVA